MKSLSSSYENNCTMPHIWLCPGSITSSSIHVLSYVSGCRRIWSVHSWSHFIRSKRRGQSSKSSAIRRLQNELQTHLTNWRSFAYFLSWRRWYVRCRFSLGSLSSSRRIQGKQSLGFSAKIFRTRLLPEDAEGPVEIIEKRNAGPHRFVYLEERWLLRRVFGGLLVYLTWSDDFSIMRSFCDLTFRTDKYKIKVRKVYLNDLDVREQLDIA